MIDGLRVRFISDSDSAGCGLSPYWMGRHGCGRAMIRVIVRVLSIIEADSVLRVGTPDRRIWGQHRFAVWASDEANVEYSILGLCVPDASVEMDGYCVDRGGRDYSLR